MRASTSKGWDIFYRAVRWLLLAAIVAYLISGWGITQYQVVERITGGWLTKSLAFRIHDNVLIPFLALLGIHVLLPGIMRLFRRK